MITSPYKVLLSPSGRMGQKDFWIAMVIFSLLVLLFNFALQRLGNSTPAFLISLPFPFLVLHMAYCVYGKRLHDMGRSFWPLTGMITSLILVAIIVMLAFGGSEFFSEFAQYHRKAEIDPAVQKDIVERYQAEMAKSHANSRSPNGYRASTVSISLLLSSVLWTGHLFAITSIRAR